MRWRRELGTRLWRRIRESAPPVVLAAVPAALSWLIAHRVLGHQQPFFAPIAAAISLSTSRIQRSRRIVQMVVGVLLGIGIGELLVRALGTSTGALALIVLLTMMVTVLIGVGFVGQGMMFANQAAVSAILVVTLRSHAVLSERAIDVLIGGGVAFVLGVILFPAEPLAILYGAERDVLETLARALRECLPKATAMRGDQWLLDLGNQIHQQLASLAAARGTAHANVRIAPRRWHLRGVVDAENQRTAQLHLLGGAVLGLLRTASMAPAPLPNDLKQQTATLAGALEELAVSERPWREATLERARSVVEQLHAYAGDAAASVAPAILGSAAGDLSLLISTPGRMSAPEPPRRDTVTRG